MVETYSLKDVGRDDGESVVELKQVKKKAEQVRDDYDYKKENALKKIAEVFEGVLQQFHGEDNCRIREDIASYTIGYVGVSFGLHVKR